MKRRNENELFHYLREAVCKNDKGIIPMILSGSNNCTEFIQGREVLERNWYPMTLSNKDKRIAIPAEELLERARAISTGDGADYEFAKQGGKWLYCKDVLKWVESGIRNAMNIERINFSAPIRLCTAESLYGVGTSAKQSTTATVRQHRNLRRLPRKWKARGR